MYCTPKRGLPRLHFCYKLHAAPPVITNTFQWLKCLNMSWSSPALHIQGGRCHHRNSPKSCPHGTSTGAHTACRWVSRAVEELGCSSQWPCFPVRNAIARDLSSMDTWRSTPRIQIPPSAGRTSWSTSSLCGWPWWGQRLGFGLLVGSSLRSLLVHTCHPVRWPAV